MICLSISVSCLLIVLPYLDRKIVQPITLLYIRFEFLKKKLYNFSLAESNAVL